MRVRPFGVKQIYRIKQQVVSKEMLDGASREPQVAEANRDVRLDSIVEPRTGTGPAGRKPPNPSRWGETRRRHQPRWVRNVASFPNSAAQCH